jgi:hypothetical protein
MPDINIDNVEYTIEINERPSFVVELNEQGPQGARGYTGNGIYSYVKTSTAGLIDTYTITFTDGNTATVDVTNGRGITSITGPISVGNVDTYTINYNDSTTSTFIVTNGIDGVNPTVTVGSTTTGNPGTNASVINSGTTRDVILDFTIPRGDKGDTGAAATIAVGAVTTGLPTDPASVTNVGTSSAAIFDFTIPKGDKGDTGATGNGIINTEKVSTVGLVDTYHVNYTNGTYDSFDVTNGRDGAGSVTDVTVNGTSVLDGSVAKVLVPTNNNQLINGAGYITGITSSDVTTALGYTPLSNATKYGADLSYSSNTLQLLDQDGNDLGSSVTIQSSPDIDNKSITTNSDDELQAIGVIDQNNTTNAIKTWSGTKAQYDAIVTKDVNTLYNITDDTDTTLTLLNLLYPVGSLYIASSSLNACPLQSLGVGTWQLKSNATLVTDVNTTAPVVGNGSSLGLDLGRTTVSGYYQLTSLRNDGGGIATMAYNGAGSTGIGVTTDPTKSGMEANITSTTLSVTIWERIS